MAFRETIFAKTLDLGKAILGESFFIAPRQHAIDEFIAKLANRPHPPEGRHRTAQLVCLAWQEPGCDHSDLHGLFLEQWHAKRFAQHVFQLFRGENHGFVPLPAIDIGVDHAALNGAGAHNRHLDHQII